MIRVAGLVQVALMARGEVQVLVPHEQGAIYRRGDRLTGSLDLWILRHYCRPS
ncbi:unannotated protein [freshwater metagenome]|uniref:Unannotated protein n=1 Tax=freshwater metagenome TaxID=449393 RepID=A0A6J6SV28_9ZZZZ